MNRIGRIFLYLLFTVIVSGCGRPLLFKENRMMMDTFVEVSCYGPDTGLISKAMEEAFDEIERIEKDFSKYDEASAVSRINAMAAAKDVIINPELFGIIERSFYYSEISEGSFDISVAPLVDIWASAREKDAVPEAEVIDSALGYVGYGSIRLDRERSSVIFLNKGMKIDLGAIAKGYAVDRAKEILSSHGIENALINIGGNIFAMGSPPGKDSWKIGIQHPRNKDEIIFKLYLKDRAVSTSGDYERFFTVGGKRFSHIINPLTGRPAEGVMSVTVVAPSAEAADVLSTAVFVMGIEKGISLITSLKDTEVFIIDMEGDLVRYP